MNVEGYGMPEDLYYDKGFMWARVDGSNVIVGLVDFAQKLAGDISYVEMPFEGDEVKQGDEVGTVETGKWVGKLYAPVSGKVLATNEKLYDDPTLINKDCYGEGWIYKIGMKDSSELKNLDQGDAAVAWLKTQIGEHR
ncbi:MAG: glycine cleavage system protein H [Candidatus Altiarchaeota archaeon]|nr:glycine cleavage system protein H [Candidatus Altiarchaeota archaeon]